MYVACGYPATVALFMGSSLNLIVVIHWMENIGRGKLSASWQYFLPLHFVLPYMADVEYNLLI